MALTRKYLHGMGLTEEQATAIIEANEETISGLKDEIEKYKQEAEGKDKALTKVQKELDSIKAETEEGKNPYKVKYEAVKEEFEAYKKEITAKEIHSEKESAFRKLLQDVGVSEKRINSVVKVSDIDAIEIEDGTIKDADKVKANIKEEWADFIVTTSETGAKTDNPPANSGGGKLTKEEIMKIKDDTKRQEKWLEYLNNQ